MFNTVDFSGDNKISIDEYMAAMGQVPPREHKSVAYSLTVVTNSFTHSLTQSVNAITIIRNKLCGRPPQYAPAACKLTFDLLTLKVMSESLVTWATSVPILVFLGLSVLDLGPMYATDKQTSDTHHR